VTLACLAKNTDIKQTIMMLKTVTLQEANGLLPLVRDCFRHLHLLIDRLHAMQSMPSRPAHKSVVFDPDHELIQVIIRKDTNKKRLSRTKKIILLEKLIAQEIHELVKLGVVVRSLFPPHVDFLSFNKGQPLYFCWHGDEDDIKHWHLLDDHSPWRQIILDDHVGPTLVH